MMAFRLWPSRALGFAKKFRAQKLFFGQGHGSADGLTFSNEAGEE